MFIAVLVQFLLYVYLNACAASIAFVLAWWGEARRGSSVDFLAAWATLFLATVVVAETVLGVLHFLTPLALAVAFGVGAAVSWLVLLRSGREMAVPPPWRDSFERMRRALAKRHVLILFVLVLWLSSALAVSAILDPAVLWDSFVYHLPMPVDWLQNHALTPMYLPLAEVANSYFPANAELLYFWALAPFRNDLLVRLIPFGFWVLLGLGSWRLCRQCGARRTASAVAVLILLLTPLLLGESADLWVDGIAVSLFVLALGHLFAYARRPSVWTAAQFGLACGLFVGTKYSGPAYLVLLWAGFAIVALSLFRKTHAGLAWRSALAVILASAATGAYWYVRNLLLAGNPVYPRPVSILGRTIFPGPGSERGDTLWDFGLSLRLRDVLISIFTGYGLVFWLAIALAIAMSAGTLYLRRRGRVSPGVPLQRGLLLIVAGLMFGSLLIYLKTPYSVMRLWSSEPVTFVQLLGGMRFSLISSACAIVLVAAGLTYASVGWKPAVFLALLAIAQGLLVGYRYKSFGTMPSRVFTLPRLAVIATLLAFLLAAIQISRRAKWHVRPKLLSWRTPGSLGLVITAVVVVLAMALPLARGYRESYRYAHYSETFGELTSAWRWIDENINGARVAYVGDSRILAAYGADYSNQVRYVNVAGGLDDRYHDFYRRGADYRKGDYDTWRRNLAAWSADYLVVALRDRVVEDDWAATHPETFTRVAQMGDVRVYRISAPGSDAKPSVP